MGLGDTLESCRNWLIFRPGAKLYTDEMLLRTLNAGQTSRRDVAVFEPLIRSMAGAPWFCIDEFDEYADWGMWLTSQRAWLRRLLMDCALRQDDAQDRESSNTEDDPAWTNAVSKEPEWMHLALLRIGLDVASLSGKDERARHTGWQRIVEILEQESRFFGGRLANVDDTGATFVFGESSLHAGYRWQALRAAIALATQIPAPAAPHIGLSAGGVLIAHDPTGERQVRGLRVKLVEHIALAGAENEIVVDDGFSEFVPYFGLKPKSSRRFRGFPRESVIFGRQVAEFRLADLPPIWGMDTVFVGRDPDLGRMKTLLREAQSGRMRSLVVEGRPGIGKTRAVWEFARRCLAKGTRVQWFSGRAEIAEQPWAVLYEWFSRFLVAHVGPVGERLDHMLAMRGISLSASGKGAMRHFIEHRFVALADRKEFASIVLRLVEDAGLVVIDDAQWIDQASAQLLEKVFGKLDCSLVISTRRERGSEGLSLSSSEICLLGPLDDLAAGRLIDNLAGSEGFDAGLRQTCLLQARGVPLYLVTGVARRNMDGPAGEFFTFVCNAVKPVLPVLGAAALLGLQWRLSDLSELVGPDLARKATEYASRANIVIGYDPDNWTFSHPLVREEMIERLGSGERAQLAEAAAALFMRRAEPARAAALLEIAGKHEMARNAWLQGAQAAIEVEDAEAACELFAHVERLGYPSGQIGLWARIFHARALIVRDGYGTPATRQLCHEVMHHLPTLPSGEGDEIAFSTRSLLYAGSGGENKTVGLNYAASLAATASNPTQHLAAEWALGTTLFWLGRFSEARPYLEAVLAKAAELSFAERTHYFPSDPWVFASIMYAWLRWFVGDPLWHEQVDDFVKEACASKLKQDACIALSFEAALRYSAGDVERFSECAATAYQVATGEGFVLWEVISGLLVAVVGARAGRPPNLESLRAAEEGVGFAYPAGINSARWLMAEALVSAGLMNEALIVIGHALDDAERCEHAYCLPDIWRLKSVAHAKLGEGDAAHVARQQARELALAMGARGWLTHWEEWLNDKALATG